MTACERLYRIWSMQTGMGRRPKHEGTFLFLYNPQEPRKVTSAPKLHAIGPFSHLSVQVFRILTLCPGTLMPGRLPCHCIRRAWSLAAEGGGAPDEARQLAVAHARVSQVARRLRREDALYCAWRGEVCGTVRCGPLRVVRECPPPTHVLRSLRPDTFVSSLYVRSQKSKAI